LYTAVLISRTLEYHKASLNYFPSSWRIFQQSALAHNAALSLLQGLARLNWELPSRIKKVGLNSVSPPANCNLHQNILVSNSPRLHCYSNIQRNIPTSNFHFSASSRLRSMIRCSNVVHQRDHH
jgi:hypothetical protein